MASASPLSKTTVVPANSISEKQTKKGDEKIEKLLKSLIKLVERNKKLTEENRSLKRELINKNKIIQQYETFCPTSTSSSTKKMVVEEIEEKKEDSVDTSPELDAELAEFTDWLDITTEDASPA